MTTRRRAAFAIAAVLLFGVGFGAARELGDADDAPQAVVTLSAVTIRHPGTIRVPDLAGAPAALAPLPHRTAATTTTAINTNINTGSTQGATLPPQGGAGGAGAAGSTTISSGDQ